ncbi:MAG: OmpH family outer membrane protein [Planctomycetes bacterium]|nr:OmpH family outer membrane protein [Planctomycetota bacterium]
MISVRWRSVIFCCGGACLSLLLLAMGAVAVAPAFSPPRTAVINTAAVFKSYEKKKAEEEIFEEQKSQVRVRLETLEKQKEDLVAEIRLLKKDSDLYTQKMVELLGLDQDIQRIQSTELKDLRDKLVAILKEIRDEIAGEIKAYARAHDLDLVLEREIEAQIDAAGAGFNWPIVHHCTAELDITQEITDRLNDKYRAKRARP